MARLASVARYSFSAWLLEQCLAISSVPRWAANWKEPPQLCSMPPRVRGSQRAVAWLTCKLQYRCA